MGDFAGGRRVHFESCFLSGKPRLESARCLISYTRMWSTSHSLSVNFPNPGCRLNPKVLTRSLAAFASGRSEFEFVYIKCNHAKPQQANKQHSSLMVFAVGMISNVFVNILESFGAHGMKHSLLSIDFL